MSEWNDSPHSLSCHHSLCLIFQMPFLSAYLSIYSLINLSHHSLYFSPFFPYLSLSLAPSSMKDLYAYTGYKYFGLCINLIVGLSAGYWAYNVALIWTASAVGYFTLKTFANNIPRHTAATGPKREFMVLGFAGAQMLTMWWLGNTENLKR
jgi:hypothetical protein